MNNAPALTGVEIFATGLWCGIVGKTLFERSAGLAVTSVEVDERSLGDCLDEESAAICANWRNRVNGNCVEERMQKDEDGGGDSRNENTWEWGTSRIRMKCFWSVCRAGVSAAFLRFLIAEFSSNGVNYQNDGPSSSRVGAGSCNQQSQGREGNLEVRWWQSSCKIADNFIGVNSSDGIIII